MSNHIHCGTAVGMHAKEFNKDVDTRHPTKEQDDVKVKWLVCT